MISCLPMYISTLHTSHHYVNNKSLLNLTCICFFFFLKKWDKHIQLEVCAQKTIMVLNQYGLSYKPTSIIKGIWYYYYQHVLNSSNKNSTNQILCNEVSIIGPKTLWQLEIFWCQVSWNHIKFYFILFICDWKCQYT